MAKTNSADRELEAMGAILTALDQLDGESIQRVLMKRLLRSQEPRIDVGQLRPTCPPAEMKSRT